jgi:GT2 family glycosyltransferase
MKTSIAIVHFGDFTPTAKCIKSVYKTSKKEKDFEIIIVDNNLHDDHKKKFEKKFPKVKYIKNKKNNYCNALNTGLEASSGDFFILLNPDTIVKDNWLKEIISPFKNSKIGGVTSKVLFRKSKRINSLGIEEIETFHFRDIGFNEEDNKNLKLQNIKYARGYSVAYKTKALTQVGGFDEDFVMYMEDVDIGIRLHKKGLKIVMNPKSIILHKSRNTTKLSDYFVSRNRFQLIAKHYPKKFAKNIKTSPFYKEIKNDEKYFDALYVFLRAGIIKLIKTQSEKITQEELPKIIKELSDIFAFDRVINLINEVELYLGLRKPRICLYDHALHFIGGGQKYGCTIAECLQEYYDTTLIANKKIDTKTLNKWYDLNLENCKIKIAKLDINKNDEKINPTIAEHSIENPFAPVEDEILKYDLVININMVPHVNALASNSIFICHFPDRPKKGFFYVNKYDKIITNSKYTTFWLKKRWGLESDDAIYPPADMEYKKKIKKENIILSVSRFEENGTKKQLEMIKAFNELCRKNPNVMQNWTLILIGGSSIKNQYLEKTKDLIKRSKNKIEIMTNISNLELKKLYAKAKVFWHACGLNQDEQKSPELIEHFGMTTVEAMQNGCAPVVIDGGGQKEIIHHEGSGFKFDSEKKLIKYTLKLIEDSKLLKQIQLEAKKSSKKYSKQVFQKKFKKVVDDLMQSAIAEKNFFPEAHEVFKK